MPVQGGANSLRELWQQPAQVVRKHLEDPSLRSCLLENVKSGIAISTSWSGMKVPELAMEVLLHVVQAEVGLPTGPGVRCVSSCDSDTSCREIAKHWKGTLVKHDSHTHVFGNVLDYLSDYAKQFLEGEGLANLFQGPTGVKRKREKSENTLERNARIARHFIRHSKAVVKPTQRARCFAHDDRTCYNNVYHELSARSEELITMDIAGSSCVERSPLGSQVGDAGDTIVVLLVWAARVRETRPVLFMHENHKNLGLEVFNFWFRDLYQLYAISSCSPSWHGWPVNRPGRQYVWGIRRDWSLLGSAEDFAEKFSFSVELVGADLFEADDTMLDKEFHRVIARRRYAHSSPRECFPDWSVLYPPGMQTRLAEHEECVSKKFPDADRWCVDVEQNVGCGPAGGPFIPCLVTHGRLVVNDPLTCGRRHATPEEHLNFQGVPVLQHQLDALHLPELPWAGVLRDMKAEQIIQLAGNGMFMPTVLYQMLYVLSRLRQRTNCPLGRPNSLIGIDEGFEWDTDDDDIE